mgnify:CR=1 FL=1
MSVRWFDTSTRGTLPARLAGQRSTSGSEATSGGREGEARPDGGRDTTTLPPYRAVCKKSSKMALSPTAPRDSADGHSRTNSVKRAICPRNVRGMSAEGIA